MLGVDGTCDHKARCASMFSLREVQRGYDLSVREHRVFGETLRVLFFVVSKIYRGVVDILNECFLDMKLWPGSIRCLAWFDLQACYDRPNRHRILSTFVESFCHKYIYGVLRVAPARSYPCQLRRARSHSLNKAFATCCPTTFYHTFREYVDVRDDPYNCTAQKLLLKLRNASEEGLYLCLCLRFRRMWIQLTSVHPTISA